MSNRLQQLHAAGVSIWLDYIDRTMLFDGDHERRIREDALTGMTSNPTIFEKALAEGEAYDEQLGAAKAGLSPWDLFELVETEDVRRACDLSFIQWRQYRACGIDPLGDLQPVFARHQGRRRAHRIVVEMWSNLSPDL